MKRLFRITSNHPDPTHATNQWRSQASGSVVCPQCCKLLPSWFPRPIDIQLSEFKENSITGGVAFAGVRTFHREFIRQVFDYLTDDFVLGRCFDEAGGLVEEYVTCYTRRPILIRGNKNSEYRTCPACKAIWPNGWEGKQYILRSYLSDARIYQNYSSTMFIDEELSEQLDFSLWDDVDSAPIDIRDEPMDGQHLPCDSPLQPAASRR